MKAIKCHRIFSAVRSNNGQWLLVQQFYFSFDFCWMKCMCINGGFFWTRYIIEECGACKCFGWIEAPTSPHLYIQSFGCGEYMEEINKILYNDRYIVKRRCEYTGISAYLKLFLFVLWNSFVGGHNEYISTTLSSCFWGQMEGDKVSSIWKLEKKMLTIKSNT